MIHENVHAVDNYNEQHRFGHGDNNSNGKRNSAPYWIEKLEGNMTYRALTRGYGYDLR